jgi:hypothetical protein
MVKMRKKYTILVEEIEGSISWMGYTNEVNDNIKMILNENV